MSATSMPLAGIRVVDFGQLTAGANTSAMLADLGADVIKVESGAYMDIFRTVGARDGAPGWWNRSPQFDFTNRNKRCVALDLKSEEGRRLVFELVCDADVLVENFRRGVMERMGLGWNTISAANPRLVFASISSQGETGPNRLHASFGSTLDATAGIAALTGYAKGKPMLSGMDVNYPDQVVSLFATGVIIAALREARRTGEGVHLDMPQRELTTFMVGEHIMEAGAGAPQPSRLGNIEGGILLQDCFPAKDGRFVALSIMDQADATRLPGAGSNENGDLYTRVASLIAERSAEEAVKMFQNVGLAAACAMSGLEVLNNPKLWGLSLVRSDSGTLVKGMPYNLESCEFSVRRPAPNLGEHTEEVLSDLGLSASDITRLDELGVTRNSPIE